MSEMLEQMVARHEGFRPTVYCDACGREVRSLMGKPGVWGCGNSCAGGHLTVGHGTRVDGAGITRDQAALLMESKLAENVCALADHMWFTDLNYPRQSAIEDMAYTMGVAGVVQFTGMIAALEAKDWTRARDEVIASKWHTEAPIRAAEIARILETDVMPLVSHRGSGD